MKTASRRQLAPIKVTTTGSPARANLRALAALLVKLDQAPPVRLVSATPPSPAQDPPTSTK